MIYVCPLSHLVETVDACGASHVVTVIDSADLVETPTAITAGNHLKVGIHDIVEPLDGCVLPDDAHVEEIIGFLRQWPREQPIVIHCWAGVSRSTATAYIAACLHTEPGREMEIAQTLRRVSPTATPNGRIIAIADRLMGREGRMVEAIASIGRGRETFLGDPFMLPY